MRVAVNTKTSNITHFTPKNICESPETRRAGICLSLQLPLFEVPYRSIAGGGCEKICSIVSLSAHLLERQEHTSVDIPTANDDTTMLQLLFLNLFVASVYANIEKVILYVFAIEVAATMVEVKQFSQDHLSGSISDWKIMKFEVLILS